MLQNYLSDVFAKYKTGDASERSYYPVLENLLKDFREESKIIIESRNSVVGIPDFKTSTSQGLLIGYIEAKDVGRDLDHLTKKEHDQIQNYRQAYPKLIVTNFIEFRLFADGQLVDSVLISQPVTLQLGIPVLENEGRMRGLLERFFATTIPTIRSSKRLSELLAHKTRVLRDLIKEEIDSSDQLETETEKLLQTFQMTLKPDMTPELFADMYAQTITFGLFVARINSEHQEFNRFTAHSLIPQTIPLLKKIFWILSGQEVPQHIKWQVDEIAEILANTQIAAITEEFFAHGQGRDPIIHFYETFLAEYDSRQREELGVYYTPPPVVSYITRSLNHLLKKHFGKPAGFADRSVIVLDPAAGTLTFPAEAIALAKEEFSSIHGTGGWPRLVKEHILKNFYAFEVMMAPYAIGHLKISLLLKELGYQMETDDRFALYLTNTLDMSKFQPQQVILAEEISQESAKAFEVKDQIPVLVIMGNPPYFGRSSNKGAWIEEQISVYKQIEGQSLGERNPKWLNDDYVKFIRFAQWKIDRTGQGIFGFITNHAWLDNPTFRGMRYSLMSTFDEIYVLNLHGSALKKEKVPADIQKKEKLGERDEGVFGIRPGIAITIGVKRPESKPGCQIYYADQWGLRSKKFSWLNKHDVENTKWVKLSLSEPFYFYVTKDETGWKKYQKFAKITDIFPVNSVGVVTSRDNFVVDFDKNKLENRLRTFINSGDDHQLIKQAFDLKESDRWTVAEARAKLRQTKNWESHLHKILYRPFDERWILYHLALVERTREETMKHLLKPNLALISARRNRLSTIDSFLCSNTLVETKCGESTIQSYTFPLYLYQESKSTEKEIEQVNGDKTKVSMMMLFDKPEEEYAAKTSNLNWDKLPAWLSTLQPIKSPATGQSIPIPEAIFYYIYAVLYSNIYRDKYQEFLKTDFPRVPFTDNLNLFKKLSLLGEQLVGLHLLTTKELQSPISRYEGEGDDRVSNLRYEPETQRLYINQSQYFDQVAPEVWQYHIGGYQVLDKWLKSHKNMTLDLDEQLHLRQVVTALTRTIELQTQIDKLYPKVEKTLAIK